MTHGSPHQRGFTLVELLVVLTILAGLATIAVRSVAGVQQRGGFERTQRLLQEIEAAVLGARTDTSREAGFLSDVGRLPVVPAADATNELNLAELWLQPAGVEASHLAVSTDDTDIVLAVGWRGPYLQLPAGGTQILDGFGAPPTITASATPLIWRVVSLGADGIAAGTGFDTDQILTVIDGSGSNRSRAEVAGTIEVAADPLLGADWTVTVVAYEPDMAHPDGLGWRLEDLDADAPTPTTFPATFAYRFSADNALTAGRRILRAYLHPVGGEPRATATRRSAPTTRWLVAGAQNLDLTIP